MSLSNLTASGWVLFALAMMYDLKLVIEVASHMRHRPTRAVDIEILPAVVFTVWLLWLVTP